MCDMVLKDNEGLYLQEQGYCSFLSHPCFIVNHDDS